MFASSDKDYADICKITSDIPGKTPVYGSGGYKLQTAAKTAHISYDATSALKQDLAVFSPVLNLLREAGANK